MKMRLQYIIIVLILLCALIGGCSDTYDTEDAKAFYVEYLEAWREDSESALDYKHFEDERHIPLQKEALRTDKLEKYEVYSIEQLNDKLWVVQVCTYSTATPDGYTCYNFVGVLDGEFRVMSNTDQVPLSLKGDLDLTSFESDLLDIDTILFPITEE